MGTWTLLSRRILRSDRPLMGGRRTAVTFSLLAFAVVVTLVTIFIMTALNRIADFANQQDDARSRETTVGALHTFQEQLHATLNDYAAWDDAAQFVYAGDKAWTVSNYGDMTVNSDLFDVAVVMDAQRRVLMAYQNGKPVSWSPDSYFDGSLWTLFDRARSADGDTPPEQVGFMRTSDGVAATGVALIRMKSGEIDKPIGERLFLIFARHLDARKVAGLEKTYNVAGLRFVDASETPKNAVDIRNVHGLLLSKLTWTSKLPGDLGYREVRPLVYGALVMVGLFFLLLFITGSNQLNRLRADEAAARQLALRDRLSGLLNRGGLFGSLDDMVSEAGQRGHHVALLYLDLDGFKEVNDAYGHGTGDQLIRGVAAGLKALVGPKARLARVGGDEFAIAISGVDPMVEASVLSDRILGFFDEPFVIGERVATVGTSIGIAASPRGKVSGDELVRRADMAMYRAKESGRGRAEYYHPDMDAEREVRNQLELDLRIAIERRELTVVYQPSFWHPHGVSSVSRRWCAGSARAMAPWRRKCSFRLPNRPALSTSWGFSCCTGPVRPGCAGPI